MELLVVFVTFVSLLGMKILNKLKLSYIVGIAGMVCCANQLLANSAVRIDESLVNSKFDNVQNPKINSKSLKDKVSKVNSNNTENDPKRFVLNLSDEVVKIMKSGLPKSQIKKRLLNLTNRCVAVNSIGKFLLGRSYRKQMTPEQKEKFNKAIANLIAERLLKQLPNGDSVTNKVKKLKTYKDQNQFLVTVSYKIVTDGSKKKYVVDFSVFRTKKGLMILNVIMDGVSASATQKADFRGRIAKIGLQAFLEELFKEFGN